MIKDTQPLSLAEAEVFIDDENLKNFIKKFTKTKEGDAKKLRKELEDLDNIKLRGENISKLIDLMPEDTQDLNKIFSDLSLDENEATKILEIVKKYK